MIDRKRIEIIFFSVLFGIIATLVFFVFKPFFTAIFLAATFAIVLFPLYEKIKSMLGDRETLSIAVTMILGLIFVLLPTIFLGREAFEQARVLYAKLSTNNIKELSYMVSLIEAPIQTFVPDYSIDINQYIRFALSWVTDNFKDVLFGTLTVVLDFFLILITLFFFLRDGKKIVKKLITLSPLKDVYDKELLEKIMTTISSIVKGTLLIALVQGILAGLGLWIFGVPNSVLWGAFAALSAFIPGLGTAIVIIPAIIYLFFTGNIPYALGLSGWGMLLVGTIDNILGPYLFKKGTKLHPVVVLFAVLGGISFFGPEGLLLGPVVVAVFVSLTHIYEKLVISK